MEQKNKVLIIGQLPKEVGGNYTTGIAKVVYELSKQDVKGVEYYVYATNAKNSIIKVHDSKACYLGYKFLIWHMIKNIASHPLETIKQWRVYRQKTNVNPLRYEFYKANFECVIEHVCPDVIHMNGCGLEPLYFANKKTKIPILLTCHGVFTRFVDSESSPRLYADYVTGLTEETRDEIHRYLCVDDKKVAIIPNGVDTRTFYFSEKERQKKRKELAIPDSTVVFITVASVSQRKGQLNFIKLLERTRIDFEYWIIGLGQDIATIQKYCEEKGLENKVRLFGYKNGDELYKYYSAADIYAHASNMEGQALCEIEAFSTGIRTVVNTKIKGTIAEAELERGDYFFLDFENPNFCEFEKWVSKEQFFRTTRVNMDWKTIADQYGKLYGKILSKKINVSIDN